MSKEVRNTDFSKAEKMQIEEEFRDTNHDLQATKYFVHTVQVGNSIPNPRRDRTPCLNHSTPIKWVIKLEKGIDSHNDRRR